MAENAPARESSPPRGRLAPGSEFAGRFVIESLRYQSRFAEVYQATRKGTTDTVSIHLLHDAVARDAERLKRVMNALPTLPSPAPEGVALPREIVAGPPPYVLSDFVDGHSLRQLLQRRQETGAPGFSQRGARNLVLQLVTALEKMPAHGGLGLDAIAVDKSGHVTVSDYGLWPLAGGTAPTRAGDVKALGALLHELLVGQAPAVDGTIVSNAGLTPEVVTVLSRMLKGDAELANLGSLKELLGQILVSQTQEPSASSTVRRNSLANAIAQGVAVPEASQPAIYADTEERWLISKGKLDYGPFAMARVIQDIRGNEILPGHVIIDSHSGQRVVVEKHPVIAAEISRAQQMRDDARRTNAEVKHARSEKRRGAALYGVIIAGVLGLGLTAFIVVRALRPDDKHDTVASIASIEEASLEPTIGGSMVEEEVARPRRKPRTPGQTGQPGGRKNTDDWDAPLDLGDASEGDDEGDERLSNSQINPVIQKNGKALGKCLAKTGTRKANIRFIVRGSGKVTYVSVNGSGNGPLTSCVRDVMLAAQFPSFNGMRTRAAFDMSL